MIVCGLSSFAGIAMAQVYKSYDSNGNVIFSDQPTKRSEEVEIGDPNLSDSFKIPPAAIEPRVEKKPEAEPESGPQTPPDAQNDSADTNNDGRISRREKEEYRKERRRKKREAEKAAEQDE